MNDTPTKYQQALEVVSDYVYDGIDVDTDVKQALTTLRELVEGVGEPVAWRVQYECFVTAWNDGKPNQAITDVLTDAGMSTQYAYALPTPEARPHD